MKTTTVSYACDLCGAKDNPGGIEWELQPVTLMLQGRSDWGKVAREMDLCGQCWLEILRVMHARCRP